MDCSPAVSRIQFVEVKFKDGFKDKTETELRMRSWLGELWKEENGGRGENEGEC